MIFSVIVPTYNRCESLRKTLESIRRQDFKEFEIIIVNDGSADNTREYLSEFTGTIVVIEQPNLGPACARNAGIREAKGSYIAFTDDDCVVPRDWLQKLHDALSSGGIDIAGGAVRNTERSIFAATGQYMTNHFVRALAEIERSTSFLTSNNVAYRLDTLRRVGGFDERFARAGGEERALHMKILDRGGRSVYLPDCVVEHAHPFSFVKFLRQQFNYGKGSYLLYRVAGRELGKFPKAIPLRVYGSLLGTLFNEGIARGVAMSVLAILAQCMIVAGYIAQAAAPRSLQAQHAGGAK